MRLNCKSILALIVLFNIGFSNGFHVVALQGVAWVKMYTEYNEVLSAKDALDITLSGKEICGICQTAEEIRSGMDDTLEDFAKLAEHTIIIAINEIETMDSPTRIHSEDVHERNIQLIEHIHISTSPPPRIVAA